MTAFPKAERVEDPDHLEWIRRRPCCFCDREAPSEAHHVIHKGMGGANVRDDMTIPVCRGCHKRCHGETVVDHTARTWRGRLGPIAMCLQLANARALWEVHQRERGRGDRTPPIPF